MTEATTYSNENKIGVEKRLDLTEKWCLGRLERCDVELWLKSRKETKNLIEDEITHVTQMCYNIYAAYKFKKGLGHFLTALIKNDLKTAVRRADNVNVKLLPLYVDYLDHIAPSDYKAVILKNGD